MSSFLNKEVINPWKISRNSIQVIKEDRVVYEYDGLEKYYSANILGILIFSVVFGVILSILGEGGKPMAQWFTCLFNVIMKMVELFMWISPVGISSIIAGKLAAMEDIKGSVAHIGMYMVTVIVACLLHAFVILPSIYCMVLKKNPFRLLLRVMKALLTVFGTNSSTSTLPITLTCLEENQKVDRRVTRFVLPIGTTVNMNGTGIYSAVIAIYIAQNQLGGPLDFGSSVLVCFTAVLSSIATAPVSGSTLIVTEAIVLQSIGIRSADISLILAVDWLLDRVTGPVNVWGNCIASAIVEHLSSKDLLTALNGEKESPKPPDCTVDFEINVAVEIEEGKEQTNKELAA